MLENRGPEEGEERRNSIRNDGVARPSRLKGDKLNIHPFKGESDTEAHLIRCLEPRDLQQEPWLGEYKRNEP